MAKGVVISKDKPYKLKMGLLPEPGLRSWRHKYFINNRTFNLRYSNDTIQGLFITWFIFFSFITHHLFRLPSTRRTQAASGHSTTNAKKHEEKRYASQWMKHIWTKRHAWIKQMYQCRDQTYLLVLPYDRYDDVNIHDHDSLHWHDVEFFRVPYWVRF